MHVSSRMEGKREGEEGYKWEIRRRKRERKGMKRGERGEGDTERRDEERETIGES